MKLRNLTLTLLAFGALQFASCKKDDPEADQFSTFEMLIEPHMNLVAEAIDLEVDASDNIYVVLKYGSILEESEPAFEKNGQKLFLESTAQAFAQRYVLIKFNSAGEPLWAHYLQAEVAEGKFAVAGNGTSYYTEQFSDQVLAVDANGNSLGQVNAPGTPGAIAANNEDEVVVASLISEETTFYDESTDSTYVLDPGFNKSAILLTYYNSTEAVERISVLSGYNLSIDDIDLSHTGKLAIMGRFKWSVDVNDSEIEISNTTQDIHGFITVFDENGSALWGRSQWFHKRDQVISETVVEINDRGDMAISYSIDQNKDCRVYFGSYSISGELFQSHFAERPATSEVVNWAKYGSLALDETGNIFTAYSHNSYISTGVNAIVLESYSNNDVKGWEQFAHGSGTNADRARKLKVNNEGSILITGTYLLTYNGAGLVINGDTVGSSNHDSYRPIIAKFSK